MKRFHVHVSVDDLAKSIRFYSTVFGLAPSVEKADYAKWMMEDPRINFAISTRGDRAGVNHLGIQVDTDAELAELRQRVASADVAVLDQKDATCCYAKSDKYWAMDPQGVPWETYHTMGEAETYGEDTQERTEAAAGACCIPKAAAATSPASRRCCG